MWMVYTIINKISIILLDIVKVALTYWEIKIDAVSTREARVLIHFKEEQVQLL